VSELMILSRDRRERLVIAPQPAVIYGIQHGLEDSSASPFFTVALADRHHLIGGSSFRTSA